MCASSSRPERGFTLPELVAVMLLAAILSAIALPKLQGLLSFRDDAWRDQVLAAIRWAHHSATGHRRLVCVDIAAERVNLTIASANPASTCSTALPGADGGSAAYSAGAAATVSPAGTLYFQPSGRVTSDGAGSSASTRRIAITGQDDIVINGETGHVQ